VESVGKLVIWRLHSYVDWLAEFEVLVWLTFSNLAYYWFVIMIY